MRKLIAGIGIAALIPLIIQAIFIIKLNQATAPGSGTVWQTVTVTAGPYPAGTVAGDLTIHISTSCFGGSPIDTPVTILTDLSPSTKRASFTIPTGTAQGQNYVWITAPSINSGNCSSLLVN